MGVVTFEKTVSSIRVAHHFANFCELYFQNLQSQFEESQPQMEQLLTTSGHLTKTCEPVVGQSVQRTVSEAQEKWSSLSRQMAARLAKLEKLQHDWGDYEQQYARAKDYVEQKGAEVSQLITLPNVSDRQRQICSSKVGRHGPGAFKVNEELPEIQRLRVLLSFCLQALQTELSAYRDNLQDLTSCSSPLFKSMDNATIIHITSRETALNQSLVHLIQTLTKHQQSLSSDLTRHSRLDFAYDTVETFLKEVDGTLRAEDPNKSADETQLRERLGLLRAVSCQFSHRQVDLDALNHIGYRTPLAEEKSRQLRELNRRWHQALSDTTERYKMLRSHLLLQQDFNQKCEDWLVFLAQVEKDLNTDIAGSYEGVLKQQQAYEVGRTLIELGPKKLSLAIAICGDPKAKCLQPQ